VQVKVDPPQAMRDRAGIGGRVPVRHTWQRLNSGTPSALETTSETVTAQ
jgi:hypothetical protein